MLGDNPEDKDRFAAVASLRDLARLPNREIALHTADVVQRRLGVDLGIGLGQPLPPVHSRQAADITRRVMHWANQPEGVEWMANVGQLVSRHDNRTRSVLDAVQFVRQHRVETIEQRRSVMSRRGHDDGIKLRSRTIRQYELKP